MGESFSAKGRKEVSEGWKEVDRAFRKSWKEDAAKEEKPDTALPELSAGQEVTVEGAAVKSGTTRPPESYTEDTLLAALENAGAEDFREAGEAGRKGIGTPATRAGIIEKLVKGGFAERRGRQLVPTARGMELIKVLPDTVKSAKLTAEWESALKEVERGERSPEGFLSDISGMVRRMVEECRDAGAQETTPLSGAAREEVGKCPRCGRPVYEGKRSFYCSGYRGEPPCGFALWKENPYFKSKRKELTKAVAAALLKDGRVEMEGLYSEKKGKTYDGTVVMEDTGSGYVNFKLEFVGNK